MTPRTPLWRPWLACLPMALLLSTPGAWAQDPSGRSDYRPPEYGRPDYGRPDYGRPDYGRPGYGGRGGEFRVDGRLCLDVTKANIRPGTALQVYECNGSEAQRFWMDRGGEIRIADLCLDIQKSDTRDGTRVVLWHCSGTPNQRWVARGGQIVSQMHGKCLDVDDGRVYPGQGVMVWSCNRNPSQRWRW